MTPDLRAWLEKYLADDPTGKCAALTQALVEAFPSLRRVRGHYFCPMTGKAYPHWWCETSEGAVIDPTSAQFPSMGLGAYEEHTGPEPTGKCPNCGGYCYDGGQVCSDRCAREYTAYLQNGF